MQNNLHYFCYKLCTSYFLFVIYYFVNIIKIPYHTHNFIVIVLSLNTITSYLLHLILAICLLLDRCKTF